MLRGFDDVGDLPAVLDVDRVRAVVLHRRWVPFGDEGGGNFVAVDLAPGAGGVVGQVINIGRDQHVRFVLADDVAEFVALLYELGVAGVVEVIEGESEELSGATQFAPTLVCLVDQLRGGLFPG